MHKILRVRSYNFFLVQNSIIRNRTRFSFFVFYLKRRVEKNENSQFKSFKHNEHRLTNLADTVAMQIITDIFHTVILHQLSLSTQYTASKYYRTRRMLTIYIYS